MRTTRRLALGLVFACLAAVQFVSPAAAARGTFTFYDADGGAGIIDPDDNTCYPLGSTVRRVENKTDRQATLYPSADCRGKFAMVVPARASRDTKRGVAVVFQRPRR
ncbi:hypothetical protein [Actinokineospora inagensis]|uniref:hypothetical protein n=1 Tax=Actinokineospora inagensis TaxID=103730 RepID=UPI0012F903D9|nr:hypothetical protein [Actinokineospora inagensis]